MMPRSLGAGEHGRKAERAEGPAVALVELALELDPVQPQRVQESGERLHAHQHHHRQHKPDEGCEADADGAADRGGARIRARRQPHLHEHLLPEDDRELVMRERERPQPQVRGRVRDRTEHELDGVDHLVHKLVGERVLFLVLLCRCRGRRRRRDRVGLVRAAIPHHHRVVARGRLALLRLVLVVANHRLWDQQEWHRDERGAEQPQLHLGLPVIQRRLLYRARAHEHANEDVEQHWRVAIGPLHRPLEENHEDEVAEDAEEENHLWNELERDRDRRLELEVVDQREEDTQCHVKHADDDGCLHLVAVEECNLVLGVVPDRVDAPRVRSGGGVVREDARAEQVDRHREALVVQAADEHGKQAIEQQDVPAAKAHVANVVETHLRDAVLVRDHHAAEGREQEAVPDVAKHDTKEEGKEDHREDARVHLAVLGHSVRIDEHLKARRELAARQVSRRGETGCNGVEDGRGLAARLARGRRQHLLQLALVAHRDPSLRHEDSAADVEVAHVQGVERHLLTQRRVVPLGPLMRHVV
mmetsp:Transcript_8129/g.20891  ORF Transcript_8129/g.20891 Transcript_8129/m.20891 type:complete len:531 (-) Transcript_8129:997-2589(-)